MVHIHTAVGDHGMFREFEFDKIEDGTQSGKGGRRRTDEGPPLGPFPSRESQGVARPLLRHRPSQWQVPLDLSLAPGRPQSVSVSEWSKSVSPFRGSSRRRW